VPEESKLLITEITRMGPGFCVIGLERQGAALRSIRPMPPAGYAWTSFPHQRGEVLRFTLSTVAATAPHLEDRKSQGILGCDGRAKGVKVCELLRQAEVADCLAQMFGAAVMERRHGGNIFLEPGTGTRSICGCEFSNLRFHRDGEDVKVSLTLPSGETMRSLPLVDRDWRLFIDRAAAAIQGANRAQRLKRFLDRFCRDRVLCDANRFARIGLSRPFEEACWFMLDTLFPLPEDAWLKEIA